jgi:sugar phosphate isomerase/epimerase
MNRREWLASMAALPLEKKARLRPALCAYSFRNELQKKLMTYEDLVVKAVEWEIDGLDMTVYWLPTTERAWLLDLRRKAYRLGVEIYSISVRTELTKPQQADRDAQVAEIRKWVDVAAALGAGHIRVFGGNVPKGVTEEQAVPWVVECLKRGGEYAGQHGVILGLENHGGICTRAERILEMVKKTDSPWVAINLDTGNFRTEAFKQIEMCLPYSANVQVKAEMTFDDGTRGPQDWDKVVSIIAASGYKGYLALEYEAKEPAPTAVPRLLGQLRELTRKYST